jgi:hypothetical protein
LFFVFNQFATEGRPKSIAREHSMNTELKGLETAGF